MCCEMQQGGKGEVSLALPSPSLHPNSSLPLYSPPTPPHLSQRHVHPSCQQTLSALSNWCKDSCCFSPPLLLLPLLFSFRSFPTLLPFILPSELSPFLCLSSVILPCTFSSGGYKGRSCWRERACVISSCTWAPESYCLICKETSQTRKGKTLCSKERKDCLQAEREEIEGRRRESVGVGFGTRTMLGSVVLLLSLLVLSTGSDARRIRKRGLNHKVGLQTSSLRLFFFLMGAWLHI